MARFNWHVAVLVAVTSAAFAAYAVAQQASSGTQGKSGSSQSSASDSSTQGQSQASSSSKQDQSKQDQSNQNRDDRSSTGSASDQGKSASSRARDDRDSARSDRDSARSNRDSARSERDERGSSRDYDRDADRNTDRSIDRNADDRASRSERDSSRERSSGQGKMRGPDIGLWFNRSSRDGLVISDVSSKGAIAKLGFREGDRIVSVDGQRVTREDEFIDFLVRSDARRVKVIVLRDGREETIFVEPAILLDERDYVEVDPLERFGIILDDRYDDRIVVWRVIPRSPAYYAGFRPGDVITTFSGRPYRTRTEFERGARDWKTGEANVQIRRGDRTRDLSVEIPNADRSDRRNERSARRDERTAQRDSVNPVQGDTNRSDRNTSDRNTNDQRNTNRRGILEGARPRGNR